MTEKGKQQRGELYNPAADPELKAELLRAKELCREYNTLAPADSAGRQAVLRRLLGHVGERCCIMPPLWCDYGYNIEVGDDFFANYNTTILDGAKVRFGNHVFVGPGCGFHTAQHPLDAGGVTPARSGLSPSPWATTSGSVQVCRSFPVSASATTASSVPAASSPATFPHTLSSPVTPPDPSAPSCLNRRKMYDVIVPLPRVSSKKNTNQWDTVRNKAQHKPQETKRASDFRCSLLSYLDSNQDKLIQSQMCYRYTIGQTQLPLSKAGAKVHTFLLLAKFFLKKFCTD